MYGDLAPWIVDGRAVSWSVTVLAMRRLIRFDLLGVGPAQVTARGMEILNGRD